MNKNSISKESTLKNKYRKVKFSILNGIRTIYKSLYNSEIVYAFVDCILEVDDRNNFRTVKSQSKLLVLKGFHKMNLYLQ